MTDDVTKLRKLQDHQQRLLDLMKEHIEIECQGPSPTRRTALKLKHGGFKHHTHPTRPRK